MHFEQQVQKLTQLEVESIFLFKVSFSFYIVIFTISNSLVFVDREKIHPNNESVGNQESMRALIIVSKIIKLQFHYNFSGFDSNLKKDARYHFIGYLFYLGVCLIWR